MRTTFTAYPKTQDVFRTLSYCLLTILLFTQIANAQEAEAVRLTSSIYGQLYTRPNDPLIYGRKYNQPVALHGVSLYWSNSPLSKDFYGQSTIDHLVDDWKVNVVRAAIGVNQPGGMNPGYLEDSATALAQLDRVVQACSRRGIYVIIDFHVGDANNYKNKAKTFFTTVAARYKYNSNVIFETWNEPIYPASVGDHDEQAKLTYWEKVLKPYHEEVITAIRNAGSSALVICGTGNYSQDVDVAANRKIGSEYGSVAYTLHFYARTHKAHLRARVQSALNKNLPIFCTEYGTTYANGGSPNYGDNADSDLMETRYWLEFLGRRSISYCQWSISAADEGSAALKNDPDVNNWYNRNQLTKSGRFARSWLRKLAGYQYGEVLTDGKYQIVSYDFLDQTAYNYNLQSSLNVQGANPNPGSYALMYPYSHQEQPMYGQGNEKWYLIKQGFNDYSIMASYGNTSMALSLTDYNGRAGVQVLGYNGRTPLNTFKLSAVNEGAQGTYEIITSYLSCLTRVKNSNGFTYLESQTCDGGRDQLFIFNFLYNDRIGARVAAETESEEKLISVYPNPSVSTFTINETEPYTFSIQNMLGRVVEEGSRTGISTVGEQLETGQYLIKINVADKTKVVKVIKQ